MVQFGFTFCDVERLFRDYDYIIVNGFLRLIAKMRLIEKYELKLIIAEAVNAGYVGSKGTKKNKTPTRNFQKWIRKIKRIITKLEGRKDKTITVWDRFKRGKSRKI